MMNYRDGIKKPLVCPGIPLCIEHLMWHLLALGTRGGFGAHLHCIFCLAASAVSELLLPGVTQKCPIGTLNYARAGITC